jgi:hypothetical protein
MSSRYLACVVLLTGCFDEGGDTAQTEAAITIADSLASFADITANMTTDPSATADALTRFVRMPVAASNLLEQPFDAGAAGAARLAQTPADLPGCVATQGPSGCDFFVATECAGGGFTFDGVGTRTCTGCELDPQQPDVLGLCSYAWDMDLGFSNPDAGITIAMNTRGQQSVDKDEVTANLVFGPYTLTNGGNSQAGNVRVCACGTAIVAELPQGRRLVNSSFVVKDFDTGNAQRCALVEFNGNGDPTSRLDQPAACACADGITCSGDLLPPPVEAP